MSAEIMSPGLSVATAPAISAPSAGGVVSGEMSFNSLSGPSEYGGTRMAGFDQAAYFETFRMPSPSPDSFEGGKFNPDFSALENTQTLWQAPEAPEVPEGGKAIAGVSAFENTEILWQAPEVNNETPFETIIMPEVSLPQTEPENASDFKSEPVLNVQEATDISLPEKEIITEPKVITKEFSMPDETIRQNAITKVREAIRYEEAMMTVKEPEKETKKPAVETEEKTVIKTQQTVEKEAVKEETVNNINYPQAKLYFEHETKADDARNLADLDAIENKVIDTILDSEIDIHEATTEVAADSKQEILVGSAIITQPNIEKNLSAMSDEMIGGNAIIKAHEAIGVKKAMLLKAKEPEKEKFKTAAKIEKKAATKTEPITKQIDEKDKEEKEKTPNSKLPKLYFEHDTKADETRKTAGLNAIEKVSKKIAAEEIVEATGQDIAEQMPNPQPKEVKSEIAKDKDGSYEGLIKQLETAGTIYSASEAKSLIEKLVNENHAVRMNSALSSRQASENEVKKVLGGQKASATPLPSL